MARKKKVPVNHGKRRKGKEIASGQITPPNYNEYKVAWSVKQMDHLCSGDWDWDLTPAELRTLLEFSEQIQQLTWGEVLSSTSGGSHSRRKKHHDHPVDRLGKQAQNRLKEVFQESEMPEALFRFRMAGRERLWGMRTGHIFHILWYDRNHRVYPTEPN